MNAVRDNLQFLKQVEKKLAARRVVSPRAEAETLVRRFARMDRIDFFTGKRQLTAAARRSVRTALKKRARGVPLSHVLGEADFLGRRFHVNRLVLTPRPETEILADEALKILEENFPARGTKAPQILDIGTGSGCLAASLTISRPDCRMTALDISLQALKIARKNIDFHGLQKRVRLVHSDLFSAFCRKKRFWDLIVSNPPYIPEADLAGLPAEVRREPRLALDGGPGGLRVVRRILSEAPAFLAPGGWLLLEIGARQSGILNEEISRQALYRDLRFVRDYSGIERVLIARKRSS